MNLTVGRARAIKEALRTLWSHRQPAAALAILPTRVRLGADAVSWSRFVVLPPPWIGIEGVVRYCRHRITNGVAEGLNSKNMTITRKACCLRNAQHLTTAIYSLRGA